MSSRKITFHGGTRTVFGFGAAFAAIILIWVLIDATVPELSAWGELVLYISRFALIAGITILILRIEGVRLSELGLSRRHVLPAIVAFAGLWGALNLVGVGLAVVTGNQWSISLIHETVNPQREPLPAPWLTTVLVQFLVVGLVEELALRGYFQTKMIALIGDGSRRHVAFGIVVASVLFGVLHIPGAVADGASIIEVSIIVASRAGTGLVFGLFYELTHNVYFVALLHGLGNTWPLVIDWGTWSGTALVAFFVGVAIIYFGATLGYRYWVFETERTPVVHRVDSASSLLANRDRRSGS